MHHSTVVVNGFAEIVYKSVYDDVSAGSTRRAFKVHVEFGAAPLLETQNITVWCDKTFYNSGQIHEHDASQ